MFGSQMGDPQSVVLGGEYFLFTIGRSAALGEAGMTSNCT